MSLHHRTAAKVARAPRVRVRPALGLGAVTLAVLVGGVVAGVASERIAGRARALAEALHVGAALAMIGAVVLLIGGLLRDAARATAPFAARGEVEIRPGVSPFISGLLTFATLICPVSAFVSRWLLVADLELPATMLILAAFMAAVGQAARPRRVRITHAGARVERALTTLVLPPGSVAEVARDGANGGLVLTAHDGRRWRAPLDRLLPQAQRELAAALRAALAAGGAGGEPSGAHGPTADDDAADERDAPDFDAADARWAVLDRNGRDLASWRRAIGALLDTEGGFRAAPVTRADLVRLLRAPRAPAERRLAAALALWDRRDADTARHIRVAAGEAGTRRVRVALERVLRDRLDDALVARAIAADERARARAQ